MLRPHDWSGLTVAGLTGGIASGKSTVAGMLAEAGCRIVDADRIAALGVPAVQINTGGGCHLDANMIENALDNLPLDEIDLLLIENVGNLVCPAEFDTGAALDVMILSVPEGDDKPLKYPKALRTSSVLVISTSDLVPYCDFDIEKAKKDALALNPSLTIFVTSATTGEGMDEGTGFLRSVVKKGCCGI